MQPSILERSRAWFGSDWLPAPVRETPEQVAWAKRSTGRRLGTALLATLVLGCVLLGLDRLLPALSGGGRWRAVLLQLPVVISVLLIARALVERRESVGFGARGAGTSLVLTLPVLLLALTDLTPGRLPSIDELLASLAGGLVIGCTEELYGRGLLVTVLGGARHTAVAVLFSSALFAYLHLPRYLHMHGLQGALLRCAGSSAFSAIFALIRLRSGSLVGPIVFHAINDAQFVFDARPAAPPEEMQINLRPVFIGCLLMAIYWVACRRAIQRSVSAQA